MIISGQEKINNGHPLERYRKASGRIKRYCSLMCTFNTFVTNEKIFSDNYLVWTRHVSLEKFEMPIRVNQGVLKK